MTFTVRDWLTRSLRLIGQAGQGETLDADSAADALVVASELLDSWAAERLTIYKQARNPFPLTNGVQRYTLGSGGDWDQARPLWIDGAAYLTAAGLEVPIKVFSRDEWQGIALKDLTSNIPAGIFYNPDYPLGAVDVWPVPTDATVQIVLYSPLAALTSVTDVNTSLSVPEGWPRAMRYNLAIELAPEWGVEPSQTVVVGAIESKATIKRVNVLQDEELEIPSALLTPFTGSPLANFDDLD